jgi:type III pantothenate kinase
MSFLFILAGKKMYLIIDIGNTLTKAAVFKHRSIIETATVYSSYIEQIIDTIAGLKNKYSIRSVILSSVRSEDHEITGFLKKYFPKFIYFNQHTPVPIKNLYGSPETLGKDRLAGVVAAHDLFPERDVLVFDAGTALTIDFIDSEGNYKGGNISPGLEMRFNALNRYTKKLPLLSQDAKTNDLIGETTIKAIVNGVQNGILYEIKTYIMRFKRAYPDLQIIFTGGDAIFFEKRIKSKIFADPILVLKGLNIILIYNE